MVGQKCNGHLFYRSTWRGNKKFVATWRRSGPERSVRKKPVQTERDPLDFHHNCGGETFA
ncbi:hypothetical protein NPIL_189191, partial [Nephila pilipes]